MSEGQSTKVLRVCGICGARFLVWPSQVKFSGAKFCSPACYHKSRTVPLAERFFRYLGRKTAAGCIPWAGCANADGYGLIGSGSRQGRMSLASRVAYELFRGPIPPGLFVLHRCDNPPCINPTHLFLGTQADNMADKQRKGRSHKRVPGSRRYFRDLRHQLSLVQ